MMLRAQAAHDTEVAAATLSGTLKKIKPWQGLMDDEIIEEIRHPVPSATVFLGGGVAGAPVRFPKINTSRPTM